MTPFQNWPGASTRVAFRRAAAVVLISVGFVGADAATAQDGAVAIDGQSGSLAADVTVAPIVSGGPSSVIVSRRPTCVQGQLVMRPDGTLGYTVPVIGPTVLRGSMDAGPATSMEVVALDRIGPDMANSIVTCAGQP
jgi:hypothetical protein